MWPIVTGHVTSCNRPCDQSFSTTFNIFWFKDSPYCGYEVIDDCFHRIFGRLKSPVRITRGNDPLDCNKIRDLLKLFNWFFLVSRFSVEWCNIQGFLLDKFSFDPGDFCFTIKLWLVCSKNAIKNSNEDSTTRIFTYHVFSKDLIVAWENLAIADGVVQFRFTA